MQIKFVGLTFAKIFLKMKQNMEIKILQIPESQFTELMAKIDRLEQNQNRIFEIASENTLYSSEEVEKILGISQKTLQIYRRRHSIEFIQIGGLVRYKKKAVEEFMEKHTWKCRTRISDTISTNEI